MNYQEAGVNVKVGSLFDNRINKNIQSTRRLGVVEGLGTFNGCFQVPLGYQTPVLVSGTDGVGAKLKLAQKLKRHDTVGVDLVAMCVNDIVTSGAEPLFFLDYLATGKLNSQQIAEVVEGMAQGCRLSGCALLGNQTAEIPGCYKLGEYDLTGFCVGVVDKTRLLDGSLVEVGDVVIGLASAGVHSKGFSLIYKILQIGGWCWSDTLDILDGKSLGEELITPTQIYVKPILEFLATEVEVHSMAHITGGGLPANLPRCLNGQQGIEISLGSWTIPPIFNWLAQAGSVFESEMFDTFNMGIGFVVIVPSTQVDASLDWFKSRDLAAFEIGKVVAGDGQLAFV